MCHCIFLVIVSSFQRQKPLVAGTIIKHYNASPSLAKHLVCGRKCKFLNRKRMSQQMNQPPTQHTCDIHLLGSVADIKQHHLCFPFEKDSMFLQYQLRPTVLLSGTPLFAIHLPKYTLNISILWRFIFCLSLFLFITSVQDYLNETPGHYSILHYRNS